MLLRALHLIGIVGWLGSAAADIVLEALLHLLHPLVLPMRESTARSASVVSAWDGDRLVGFARAISDGVPNAYVSSVMVDEASRRGGIGRELIRRLMDGRGPEMRWVLHARSDALEFWSAAGFTPATNVLWQGRT